jgi:hypothetical protein
MTAAGKGGAARASRSGTRLSYADRVARGQRRIEVWLPADVAEMLDEICESGGYSRPEMVEQMIRSDHATLPRKRLNTR